MIPSTLAIVVAILAQDRVEPQELNLTRALGYGAGIHHFKNYVLRATENYRTQADESLGLAEKALASLRTASDATAKDKEAIDAIEKVVKQYRANLPVAQKMHVEGKSIKEIDAAVKVDDGPAIAGLAVLRDRAPRAPLPRLETELGYGGAIHAFKNYVLRGREEYRTAAQDAFRRAQASITALRATPTFQEKDLRALDEIEGVVKKYSANLEIVQKMHAEGKSIKEIDMAVRVVDLRAVAALELLRKN